MKKAEKTKQFILEQAAILFNEKGISGTSIDDVLKVSKVAKGCLYSHFENKEALSYAIVDHLLYKLSSHIRYVIEREKTAKLKLFAIMDVYKNPLNPVVEGGCPILNFGVESDDTNPIIKQKIELTIRKSMQNIARIINQGILDKEFAKGFDGEEFALKMLALMEGGMMICRVMNSNVPMHKIVEMLRNEIKTYELK